MKITGRKVLSLVLALAMALGVMSVSAMADSASTYTDVPQSFWGYEAITKWSTEQYNVLRGYGDGRFGPNDQITAEQLAWINGRILGIADKDVAFSGAGSRALTRAEAVTVIAQAFGVAPLSAASAPFADNSAIPAEYRGYVNAMKAAGYVRGVGDNVFDPNSTYTRAQALQVVYNMTADILDKSTADVKASKNIVIRKAGTTLSKSTVDGDLIIGQGVGDGDVILEDVTVNGKLLVLGGGSNSVIIRGTSKIPSVRAAKASGQTARVKVEGAASVGQVTVASGCSVIVNGTVTSLVAEGGNTVQLQSAKVNNVSVEGAKVTLTVDASSTVATATVAANDVKVQGGGKVNNVNATANAKSGVVVDTNGTKVTTAAGAGDVKNSAGTVVAKGGSAATTGGSGGTTYYGGGGGGYSGGGYSGGGSSGGGSTPTPAGEDITITYNGNGNTSGTAPAATATQAGKATTLEGKGDLAKDGFTFLGWATNASAVEAEYTTSGTFSADTTLYAIWKAVATVSSVTVSQSTFTGAKDDTVTITATVLPADVEDKSVTWTSSDESAATVENGVITIVGESDGTATITATSAADNTKKATVAVTVVAAGKTNIAAATITLNADTAAYTGSAIEPTVTAVTLGETDITANCDVTYSNNTDVGTATVTVTAKDSDATYYGTATKTFTITAVAATVTPPTAKASLTYDGSAQDLITAGSATGGTLQYKLGSGAWQTAVPTATEAGTYSVSYRVVADANHTGVEATAITGVEIGQGTATLAFASAAKKVKMGETVTNALTNASSLSPLTWTSSDTKVATVDNTGAVTLVGAGTTTIKAAFAANPKTYKAAEASYDLTVLVLKSISVKTPPTKTTYYVNDDFDKTGMVITATYSDDTTDDISDTAKFTCTPATFTAANASTTVTVTYGGKTATTTVAVTEDSISSIAVTANPSKTSYVYNETFDATGMEITAQWASGKKTDVTSGCTYSTDALTTIGDSQDFTITHTASTKTTTVSINVAKATPTISGVEATATVTVGGTLTITPTVAGVEGSFGYVSATIDAATVDPAAGASSTTVTGVAPGESAITVTFTPTDTAHYNTNTATCTVTVNAAP